MSYLSTHFTHFGMCGWRMLTLVRKVVIPVDTQRVHHFSTAGLGGMMNQVYLQELQSGPSCVASSTHAMLG